MLVLLSTASQASDFDGVGIQPDIPMPVGAELEELLEIIRNHAAGRQN